jgi:hypothetical protein
MNRHKKQHYSRLTAKSDNKVETTRNIVKQRTRKVHLTEHIPHFL